jgi:hypothetical protein
MNRQPLILFLIFAIVCLGLPRSLPAQELQSKKPCRQHPQLVAACFQVHGRLSAFNGAPSLRIWPVGSKRLLGISEGRFALPDFANIPPELVAQLGGWDNAMFADFTVCPFTEEMPGVMRFVCVDSARNIIVRKRE